jgi:hypothetical protein
MTLQQLIREPVTKTIEQELKDLITNKNVVIKVEAKELIDYVNELVTECKADAKICYCNKNLNGSYVQAILYAYSTRAEELIIINKTDSVKWLKQKIEAAKKDMIVEQLRDIMIKYDYHLCPVNIINY